MKRGQATPVIRYIRKLMRGPPDDEDSDGRLLQRFVAHADESAFEALVQRHGPMVLGVCRRLLPSAPDVEDAFQATFLVLVRKAGSIRWPERLSCWLHGVARRVADRVRMEAAQRKKHESAVPLRAEGEPFADVVWRDLRTVLDDEVQRLPEKYRTPFILCYLEGRTNEEAARHLGCPTGTVLSRLAWARDRLRARLTRRGVTLSTAFSPVALAE